MSRQTEELLGQALKLSLEARAGLGDSLIESPDEKVHQSTGIRSID